MIRSAILIQYTCVTDRHRQTDRQMDGIGVAYTRYSIYAVARKNYAFLTIILMAEMAQYGDLHMVCRRNIFKQTTGQFRVSPPVCHAEESNFILMTNSCTVFCITSITAAAFRQSESEKKSYIYYHRVTVLLVITQNISDLQRHLVSLTPAFEVHQNTAGSIQQTDQLLHWYQTAV